MIIDCWHHVHRGYKDQRIDYCKLILFQRKKIAEHLGVKTGKKDENKMEWTKSLGDIKGALTRFSIHNAINGLLLDMNKWGNLHLAQCKTLEKTNKDTKQAITKGGIGDNMCNRIMRHRTDRFKLTYLCEGNGVTDEGVMDPLNGRNKLDLNVIKQLRDCKWLSIFLDQQLNPSKPEYCNGSKIYKKIRDQMYISPFTNESFKFEVTDAIWEEFSTVYEEIEYFQCINYWRKQKKSVVGIGSLLTKMDDGQKKLMMVVAICRLKSTTKQQRNVVIGHNVELDANYDARDRVPKATITSDIICWDSNKIYSNAHYYHLCDVKCRETRGVLNHSWKEHPRIVIFWSLGMGKHTITNPLIDLYNSSHFHYPLL